MDGWLILVLVVAGGGIVLWGRYDLRRRRELKAEVERLLVQEIVKTWNDLRNRLSIDDWGCTEQCMMSLVEELILEGRFRPQPGSDFHGFALVQHAM